MSAPTPAKTINTPSSKVTSTSSTSSSSTVNSPPINVNMKSSMVKLGNNQAMVVPAGYSEWAGPSAHFTGAAQDTMRIRVRIPLCTMGLNPSTTSPTVGGSYPAMQLSSKNAYGATAAIKGLSTIALGPTLIPGVTTTAGPDTFYPYVAIPDCSILGLLSAAFTKYRCVSDLHLEYSPTSGTSADYAFALAFTDDPMHQALGFGAYVASNYGTMSPTFNACKNSLDSKVFSSWLPWKQTFQLDRSSVYYTTASLAESLNTSGITYGNNGPFDEAILRFSHFGAISAFANSLASGEEYQPLGELFMSIEMEFFDLAPSTGPASFPYALIEYTNYWFGERKDPIMIADEDVDFDEKTKSSYGLRDVPFPINIFSSRGPPTLRREGTIRIQPVHLPAHSSHNNRQGSVVRTPRFDPRASPIRRNTVTKIAVSAPRNRVAVRTPRKLLSKSRLSAHQVVAHLLRNKSRLPQSSHGTIMHMKSLITKKKKGSSSQIGKMAADLVKKVPIVGDVLGELVEGAGPQLLSMLLSLF